MLVKVSVSQLSHAFRMGRETVARRLADGKVAPVDKRSGRPVYALHDCVPVLAPRDADTTDPFRRLALAQATSLELKLAAERGAYLQVEDVREQYASGFKPVRRMLDALPDALERDAGLTAPQVAPVERAVDALRRELAEELGASDADGE